MANLNNLILALIRQAGFTNAAQARRFFAPRYPLFLTLLQPCGFMSAIPNLKAGRFWRDFQFFF
jgi:hypothetical protein